MAKLHQQSIYKNKSSAKNIKKNSRSVTFLKRIDLQEKTSAAAAPRKPKKGAVSSPLKVDISADSGSYDNAGILSTCFSQISPLYKAKD